MLSYPSLLFMTAAVVTAAVDVSASSSYGVDCSFPIHHMELNCGNLLDARKDFYKDFMDGCRDEYPDGSCDEYERDRIIMSLRQPQSMVNYTSTGFKKIQAPAELWRLLSNHWELNKDQQKQEEWGRGNIYVNHWASPTYMVSVEDKSLVGGGLPLKNQIWDAAQAVVEEWTQMEQRPSSMYGIRVYTEGAVLNPHADRLPLVSSATINVAQDVDEPWVLEVYDRQGQAVNVTMEPGDMVLYESGSLIHGLCSMLPTWPSHDIALFVHNDLCAFTQRPFPLKGRYYANIFIHFEPTGRPLHYQGDDYVDMALDNSIPPCIMPNSPQVEEWKSRNPTGWHMVSPSAAHVDTSRVHEAAAFNDMKKLQEFALDNQEILFSNDRNGWQPIHEAARGGHTEAVEFLVSNGANVNVRTHGGKGVSPLNIAINAHSENHEVSQLLKDLGGVSLGPEL